MPFVEVLDGLEFPLCESASQDEYPYEGSLACQYTINHGSAPHPFFVLFSLDNDDFRLFPCFSRRTDLFFERSTCPFLKSVRGEEVLGFFEPDGGPDVDLVDVPIGPFAPQISPHQIFLFGRQDLGVRTPQNALVFCLPLPHLAIIKHQRPPFLVLCFIFAIFFSKIRRLDIDLGRGDRLGELGLHFVIFCL